MEANPFSTTLHIAIERPRMPARELKRVKAELHAQGRKIWEEIIDSIRGAMQSAGIDLTDVTVEMKKNASEDQERYFTIEGIRSDEAATVRAIFEELFVVSNDNFNPTDYDEDEEDESWRPEPEEEDESWRGEEEDNEP